MINGFRVGKIVKNRFSFTRVVLPVHPTLYPTYKKKTISSQLTQPPGQEDRIKSEQIELEFENSART